MSWILLPWPTRRPVQEQESSLTVLVDLREFQSSHRPFREEKPGRVLQEKAAEPLSGLITSIRPETKAKEETSPEAKETAAAGLGKEKIGGRKTDAMGAPASRLSNGNEHLSSMPSMETAAETAPESRLPNGNERECLSSTPSKERAEAVESEGRGRSEDGALIEDLWGEATARGTGGQECPVADSEEEQEVTSHTLDEPEDGASRRDESEDDEDKSRQEEDGDVSSSSSSSSESSEERSKPSFFPHPWMRFSSVMSKMEPWNSRSWLGFHPFLGPWGGASGISGKTALPLRERLRCSVIYASVMLRSYRRKFFRKMKASVADWRVMPKCPKRSLHRSSESELQDL